MEVLKLVKGHRRVKILQTLQLADTQADATVSNARDVTLLAERHARNVRAKLECS